MEEEYPDIGHGYDHGNDEDIWTAPRHLLTGKVKSQL